MAALAWMLAGRPDDSNGFIRRFRGRQDYSKERQGE
jgi:hypothetical protein